MPVSKIVGGQKIASKKLERARQLRQEMTPEEELLWEALRRNQQGAHFRRQQIIAGFIVDFYCHAAGLVVEVDGAEHDAPEQKAMDARRDQALREMGLRVMRFRNRSISTRLPQMLERIRDQVRLRIGNT